MARPTQEKAISEASSTTTGSEYEAGSRITVMLHVVAKSLDTGNDTVQVDLEVSQDGGTNWAKLRDEDGNQVMQITVSEMDDPDGNGDFAAHVYAHGVTADKIRPNLTSFSDNSGGDLEVDVFVGAYGREAAQQFRTV